jgi:hypothetical protein
MGAEAWLEQPAHAQHDRAHRLGLARDADERGGRRSRGPVLGEGAGDLLHPLRPDGAACANCHEANNGNYIRADHLSQGHINGFPTYRFATRGLVSRHNRFFGCIRDTRGEPYAIGSPEFVALELYVASRGNGLSVEGTGRPQLIQRARAGPPVRAFLYWTYSPI